MCHEYLTDLVNSFSGNYRSFSGNYRMFIYKGKMFYIHLHNVNKHPDFLDCSVECSGHRLHYPKFNTIIYTGWLNFNALYLIALQLLYNNCFFFNISLSTHC